MVPQPKCTLEEDKLLEEIKRLSLKYVQGISDRNVKFEVKRFLLGY